MCGLRLHAADGDAVYTTTPAWHALQCLISETLFEAAGREGWPDSRLCQTLHELLLLHGSMGRQFAIFPEGMSRLLARLLYRWLEFNIGDYRNSDFPGQISVPQNSVVRLAEFMASAHSGYVITPTQDE